ncbi:MAG: flagellar hook-length control protein FliK, partial [Deltaproteobacteria bacterium]|nr:flagellar hook-length control protein FliK [Deltaproteobacteria bacterium]
VSGQSVPDTDPQPQSQNDSGALQETLSQNLGSYVQEGGINGNKDVLKDILSQLGFTQEEISSFFDAKDLSQLKELLLKLGLNASEAEHFMESNSHSLKDEEGLFLSKLVNALEQKGLSPDQAREMGKMITELNLELRQVDRPLAVEGQPRYAIKDLLLQLGIHPEDGKIPADRLNEILLKMGMSPEEVDKLAETGKLPVQDLKAFLIKMGINPEAAAGLVDTGEHPGKEMSIRELLVLLRDLQNLSGGGAAHLVEKEGVSSGSDSTPHSGQGEVDLNGRGLMDVNSIVSGEIEGGKSQVDFEQVMSKTELREATSQKVMEQVVKVAKVQVVNGQARAKISLHPPTLGKLQMHIITEGNQVKATFFAETAQAKEIIENNLPQLRQSFLQQGLKVENFNVFVGYHPNENQTEKHGFFNSGTAHNLGEGGPEGEDILAVEEMKGSAMGNHTVDLFI